jgi:hypothetical protein
MTSLSKVLVGTAIGAGMVAFSALSASAAVVCTGSVCWHTQERYEYPPTARVIIHDDNWRAGPGRASHSASTKAAAIGAATAGPSGDGSPSWVRGRLDGRPRPFAGEVT